MARFVVMTDLDDGKEILINIERVSAAWPRSGGGTVLWFSDTSRLPEEEHCEALLKVREDFDMVCFKLQGKEP